MPKRTRASIAFVVCSGVCSGSGIDVAALAHYDDTPAAEGASHMSSRAPGSKPAALDPWQLLELAITPAHAAGTSVSIGIEGPYRIIRSNGLPDHPTGDFPNPGNPNSISAQNYVFRMPAEPVATGTISPLGMFPFGVAINGIPFDPGAAEFWNNDRASGWQYEAMALGARLGLDQNNAHVQPNGSYHYHGPPTGLLDELSRAPRPTLLGYAADGFPIYGPYGHSDPGNPSSGMKKLKSSYRLKAGTRPDGPGGSYDGLFVRDWEFVEAAGDLDACNGRFGVTSEYPQGTYHYVITTSFPYIPRAFKGTPDPSFRSRGGTRRPPGFGGPGFGPRGGPPGFGRRGFGPPAFPPLDVGPGMGPPDTP